MAAPDACPATAPASPVVLGWREWAALPALGVCLRAKVDTGARTSSLHVERQWRTTEQGAPWVGLEINTQSRRATANIIQAALPLVDERMVSDSGGHRVLRPFVRVEIVIGGCARQVEMNLASRRGMLFPLLVGRSALDGCVVAPAASFLYAKPPVVASQRQVGRPRQVGA